MLTAFVLISSIVAGDGDLREQPSRAPTTVSAKRRCKGRSAVPGPGRRASIRRCSPPRRRAARRWPRSSPCSTPGASLPWPRGSARPRRCSATRCCTSRPPRRTWPRPRSRPAGLAGADADVRRAEALRADRARADPRPDRAARRPRRAGARDIRASTARAAGAAPARSPQLITGGVFVLVAASGVGAAIGGAVTLRRLEGRQVAIRRRRIRRLSRQLGAARAPRRGDAGRRCGHGRTRRFGGCHTHSSSVAASCERATRPARTAAVPLPPALSGFRVIGRF